jgi:hypothetical protein
VVGLQLRMRFVPAALLAMLRTALALQCVSKARDWTGHVEHGHVERGERTNRIGHSRRTDKPDRMWLEDRQTRSDMAG